VVIDWRARLAGMRRRRRLILILVAVVAAFPLAGLINGPPPPATDYERELTRIQNNIADLAGGANAQASEIDGATAFLHLLYRRATLTGSVADVRAADAAIGQARERLGPTEDVLLLKATIDFTLHRLPETKRDLDALSARADSIRVRTLRADLAVQEGRYEEARRSYAGVAERGPRWDTLARLAYLESRVGDPELADRLYAQAEDELSAKEMRAYAWVRLQRGLLSLRQGRHDEAMTHYRRAERAYSGYWLVDEHIAELLGAQRKFDEALALYRSVIARAPRAELHQALGDLYVVMGRPEQAAPWHDAALALYLDSARRGEMYYYHHLASFYADVRRDGAEAVRWARKEAELRPNPAAHEALAWALYRESRYAEALSVIGEALASGVKDAHLFFHAAMIHLAAGRNDDGRALLARAAKLNPRYESFHVHR
jgi:tetratricopeptide (TPR) repeat protein